MDAMAGSSRRSGYVPALHYRWLTPLYDPVLRWLFRERPLKRRIVALADPRPGQRILDLGCGTGTLTLALKQAQPQATLMGLDGDPDVLGIARRKAAKTGVEVQWDLGLASGLPYPSASFDTVVASLVLHHLDPSDRVRALQEAARVLRPGGTFLVADFGPPQSPLERSLARISELLEETEEGVEGRLPARFAAAGLLDVELDDASFLTPTGRIVLYRARHG